MCFERTDKKIKPFHIGYRVVYKDNNKYHGCCSGTWTAIPINEWVDEMPYRAVELLLKWPKTTNIGWHILSTLEKAKYLKEVWLLNNAIIVRVECYGLKPPYGLGLAFGKPAGRFQFMKILEEVT